MIYINKNILLSIESFQIKQIKKRIYNNEKAQNRGVRRNKGYIQPKHYILQEEKWPFEEGDRAVTSL